MNKVTKPFEFLFPVTKRKAVDLRLTTVHQGDLQVQGIAYYNSAVSSLDLDSCRYSVEISSIKWNGAEIKDFMEADMNWSTMYEIEYAATQHASTLFTDNKAVA